MVRKVKVKKPERSFNEVLDGLEEMGSIPMDKPLLVDGKPIVADQLYEGARIAGDAYRYGCGMASRKNLDSVSRNEVRSLLFKARHVLDARIENNIKKFVSKGELPLSKLLRRQVFGFCKKQGASFRLSLSTCIPSPLCGGGCYAHDGRERVTSTILSGCYNTLIAEFWEQGIVTDEMLVPHIKKAADLALVDAKFAQKEYGLKRRARIRLAHVGELSAFPKFANWLGTQIRKVSKNRVDGIIYTRHPNIKLLDVNALVVNLTIDEKSESRRKWQRDGVRVVWSAWDGKLDPQAKVNFLEHHDHGQHAEPKGEGAVCPVTASVTEERFCDAFHCTKCFDDPRLKSKDHVVSKDDERKAFRTRTQGMLREVKKKKSK